MGSCPESKSKRPRTDDDGNEVEEFFTLVDRIQALNKLYKKKRMNSTSAEGVLFMEEIVGSDVLNGKPPWKPKFQPEDFSEVPSKGTPCAHKDSTRCMNEIAGDSGLCQKENIGRKKLMGMESFDLNVEATSDQSASEVLRLFS
ncbi:hypothetical protein SUGI_0465640 [Cryptomeria japonica]|nr:hypothetical protein SUGI_0465640 [Cryptomeria japonica]